MDQISVNQHTLRVSWFYLLLWIASASALTILLVMRSPYWLAPLPGLVFLYMWFMLVTLYPRSVHPGETDITLLMTGSGRERHIPLSALRVNEQEHHVEIKSASDGGKRKYLLSKKDLSPEVADYLRSRSQRPPRNRRR
ncbi:hypothetical protein J2T58_000812 [Methanocalculus alkaliphilus]|uniref:hypothetical protein n=1 Tax=Methanocalculus alkaliphilus TaxID=768730 RepID=UPI00209D87F8|nr:hypothetical protein [Methanocalculus alkaliphilus]MCP1714964.1 hypothetical protein [Methanocalculus alkaliphilus]